MKEKTNKRQRDMEDYDLVKSDFNEIAELDDPKWNHNSCYYSEIVDLVPDDADTCLDIGCGKGDLAFSYLTQVPFSSSGSTWAITCAWAPNFPLTASSMSWTSLWAVSTSSLGSTVMCKSMLRLFLLPLLLIS
jgi:SAM-dependent methyltransferase